MCAVNWVSEYLIEDTRYKSFNLVRLSDRIQAPDLYHTVGLVHRPASLLPPSAVGYITKLSAERIRRGFIYLEFPKIVA